MKIPTYLKHKPVFTAEDYDRVDGMYVGNSDAKGLSLGLAQWNERGRMEISAKVWRHTGGKWSRQSEELPMHRVLDLAILILQAKAYLRESCRFPKLYDPEHPQISRLELEEDAMTISVCTGNPMIDEDMQHFAAAMNKEGERLDKRLILLGRLLKEAGYVR